MARHYTIARMTITYIALSVAVANLAVSLYYLPVFAGSREG